MWISRSALERQIRRAERAEDRLYSVLDAVAEHRQGDLVPVGPILAALVLDERLPTAADAERGREIADLTDQEETRSNETTTDPAVHPPLRRLR